MTLSDCQFVEHSNQTLVREVVIPIAKVVKAVLAVNDQQDLFVRLVRWFKPSHSMIYSNGSSQNHFDNSQSIKDLQRCCEYPVLSCSSLEYLGSDIDYPSTDEHATEKEFFPSTVVAGQ